MYAGIYSRALNTLFEVAAAEEQQGAMSLSVAFMEVYNEAVRDLLVRESGAMEVSGIPAGQLSQGVPERSCCDLAFHMPSVLPRDAHVEGCTNGNWLLTPGADRIPGLTWRSVNAVGDIRIALKVQSPRPSLVQIAGYHQMDQAWSCTLRRMRL
jgi:Kinesin motor domain